MRRRPVSASIRLTGKVADLGSSDHTVRYILNPGIALRSWALVPYAYYIRGKRNAWGLKKEEFEFLSACDGMTELPSVDISQLADSLFKRGFIRAAKNGETMSDWGCLKCKF